MEWYLIGTAAALLTTFGFVPQIIKIHRTKCAKGVSLATFYQYGVGVILWTLYGIHLGDIIIITANTVSFITIVAAIVLYYRYD
ncbi:PQ loop repeat protein [uncultured archaeon]|nr:PQ loop repeat protein [uncultured archaeon]